MIRTDTAASSGEAELAEDDASSPSFSRGELTAVYTPPLVGKRHKPRLNVKLDKLTFGFLDDLAWRAFVR